MDWFPLKLSLQVAAYSTLLSLILGVSLAALLARPRMPARHFIDALVTIPLVLPPTVLGYYLLSSLGRRSAIGGLWESLTGSPLLFSVKGCVIAATVGALPLVVLSARAAFESVDESLVKAARTLGAGPLRAFLTVRLPLAFRGILAGLMLGFAKSLGDFGVTLMVAGDIPGETQTASLYIYDSIMNPSGTSEAAANAMILVLTVTAVATLYGVNRLTRGGSQN